MLNIKFKGICENEGEIKKNAKLYKNSIMYKEETTIKERIKKSKKFMVLAVIIVMLSILITADLKNIELEFNLVDLLISVLMIIPLMLVFEIIVILLYPLKAKKDLYITKKDSTILLISNSLITKKRFIIICLIPIIVLLVIPYVVVILTMGNIPIKVTKILAILSVEACAFAPLNIMEIYNTIKQVPKGAKIFNYGYHSYWTNNKN